MLAGALLAGAAGATERPREPVIAPLVLHRDATAAAAGARRTGSPGRALPAGDLGAQAAALRQARHGWPFTADALARPNARLGILRRTGGIWRPARPALSRRDELLRGGTLAELHSGELARTPAPAAAAAGVASVPGQDVIRILVLRIDFLHDRSGTQTTGDGHFDDSPRDTVNVPVDPTPHDSLYFHSHMEALRRYYDSATAGRTKIEWEIYPKADSAYHADDMADYGPWRVSPDIFPIAYAMFHSFIAAADTQDTSIPWANFDRVVIFHAGSDLQSDLKQDSPNDIPTFTIFLDDSLAVPVGDSTTKVFSSSILPETANQDGYFAALNAVIAHENGHNIFGWRDVYDVNSGFPVCGEWTLMDTGNLVGSQIQVGEPPDQRVFYAIGILPPLADPYQRHLVYADVPRADQPAWGELDSLRAPLVSQRMLDVPLSSEEHVLLENRRADLNGDNQIVLVRDPVTRVILGPGPADSLEYDFLLPGEGVLAWHVDESVVAFDPPGLRADPFFTLNGNPDRRGLRIFEADGLDDIGDPNSIYILGSPLDPFFVPNNSRLARDTRPPLVTNSDTDPHVTIEIPDTLGPTMHVRVSRAWETPGWPVVVRPGKDGVDPLVFAGAGGAGPRRVAYAAGDSAIHARAPDGAPAGALGGDVLWRAPASVSPLAAVGDPLNGAPLVAVYPDPATLDDSTWATGGSWVVELDVAGNVLPGFPVRVLDLPDGSPDWITAGPVAFDPDGARPGSPVAVVGTRSGQVEFVAANGSVGTATAAWTAVENGGIGRAPILALAVTTGAVTPKLAAADSLGGVSISEMSQLDAPLGAARADAATAAATAGAVGYAGWQPLLAWVEMNQGADGAMQRAGGSGTPQLVVLDRRTGAGAIYDGAERWTTLSGANAPLARGLAAGDLDGDGFNELVLGTQDGRVGFWNLSGRATPGWPRGVEPEPFACQAAPLTAHLSGATAVDLVTATGSGRLVAIGPDHKPLPGWPLGTGAGQVSSPALLDLDGDGALELLIADKDSLLYAFAPDSAPDSGAVWPLWGHDAGRTFSLVAAPTSGPAQGGGALVEGSVRCYPNPAKRSPVTVSFRLREPAKVVLTLYDASGRRVGEVSQDALASDNALVWDPAGQSSGLYLGRLRIQAASGEVNRLVHIGVLR